MTCRPLPPPGWEPPGPAGGGAVHLLDAAAARDGDARAVAAGATWHGLMRRAAGHLARGVLDLAGGGYGRRVVVVVGKGNNGGDGWSAAALLRRAGAAVTIVAPHGLDTDGSDEATAARAHWLATAGRAHADTSRLEADLARADVVVDCLLGTGTTGAPREPIAGVVAAINAAGRPTVACDVPSGVDADDGQVAGDAVRADLTVTFGAAKRGLLLHPGADHVGRLVVGDLGPRYPVEPSGWSALTAAGAAPAALASGAEKRTRGVTLVVAGAVGASGAAALCTAGLQAAGSGLVTTAVPEPVAAVVAGLVPAAMTRPLPHDRGLVAPDAVDALQDLDGFDVVVAGPGLQPTKGTRAVVDHLRTAGGTLVLDADALNVHRDDPDVLADHIGHLVLTPHERELARLAGEPGLPRGRTATAVDVAARLGATVVAKGPRTVVAAADGRVWVTPVGGPALATGGTGDVLAGMVAAAVAGAGDVPLAAARAVWLHALTGDVLGAARAQRLTADELARAVPWVAGALVRVATRRPAWPLDGGGLPDELGDVPGLDTGMLAPAPLAPLPPMEGS